MANRFDADTAITRLDAHRFEGRIDRGWWVVRGPNGGYVAAILLRALRASETDPEREPRSLTVHFTAPPQEGAVEITTRVERRGRSLTTLSARLQQGDRLLALALAAFSKPRRAFEFHHAPMPDVKPPERIPPPALREGALLPIHARYDTRWAVGDPPWSGAKQALCGGWIRLAEPRIVDAAALTAFSDAFPPAVFSLAKPGEIGGGGVPTVDLSLHFRAPLPRPGARPDDFTLAVFRSREARDGFLEEDGEIWSRDGVLLALSRQLAILG